ncbi:hypothetical protein GCM10020220_080620 [Nonomuraea rubra]
MRERVLAQSLADVLAQLEGGYEVERERGDDAECADRHHGAGEVGVAARERQQRAVGGDELDPRHGGGQAPHGVARAVRAGRDRAADGDVRQRGQVRQREPGPVQQRRERRVRRARPHPHRGRGAVDLHLVRHPVEHHQVAVGVGDVVEGVRAAEGPHGGAARDEPLQLVEGGRMVEVFRVECGVSSPIAQRHGLTFPQLHLVSPSGCR